MTSPFRKTWIYCISILLLTNLFLMFAMVYDTPFILGAKNGLGFTFFAWAGSLMLFSQITGWKKIKWPLFLIGLCSADYLCAIDRHWVGIFYLCLFYLWIIYALHFLWSSSKLSRHQYHELLLCLTFPLLLLYFGLLLNVQARFLPLIWDELILAMEGGLHFYPSLIMGKLYLSLPFILRQAIDFMYMALPLVFFIVYNECRAKSQRIPFDLLFEFFTIALVGGLLYNLVPACGSQVVFSESWPYFLPDEFTHRSPKWLQETALFTRNTVPSLHITWMVCLVRRAPLCSLVARVFLGLFAVGTAVSIFGIGQHYLVDALVGLALANFVGGCFAYQLGLHPARLQAILGGGLLLLGWYGFIFYGRDLLNSSSQYCMFVFLSSGVISLWWEYRLIKTLGESPDLLPLQIKQVAWE